MSVCVCQIPKACDARRISGFPPSPRSNSVRPSECRSDHVGRHAVERHVARHPQQVDVLQAAHAVLVLQQVGAVDGHFEHVLLDQDLQLWDGTGRQGVSES